MFLGMAKNPCNRRPFSCILYVAETLSVLFEMRPELSIAMVGRAAEEKEYE